MQGRRHRHVGTRQGRQHPVLAIDRVGRRQELSRRLLAQDHVAPVGRQEEGGVGLAAAHLAHGKRPGEAQGLAQVALERRLVETVGVPGGDGVWFVGHAGGVMLVPTL